MNPLSAAILTSVADDCKRHSDAGRGKNKAGLQSLVPATILKRYEIDPDHRATISRDLLRLGITESVAYPDLDGLARDLRQRFLGEAV